MPNQEQYIPHRLSQFEKATTGIVAALITGLLAWVGVSVSNQQVQQATMQVQQSTIITTQTQQSAMLTKMQTTIDNAVPARNALITSNALLAAKVAGIKEEVNTLKADVKGLEAQH